MSLPLRIAQWWKHFQSAADAYPGMDPYLLAAICDRESNGGLTLDPPGPSGTGDHGHGRGLMQIDDRANSQLVAQVLPTGQPAWQDPAANIAMGAFVLDHALVRFRAQSDCPDAEMAAAASYNAGEGHAHAALEALTKPIDAGAALQALDAITTGGDYVSDVLTRRARFLQNTSPPTPPPVPVS